MPTHAHSLQAPDSLEPTRPILSKAHSLEPTQGGGGDGGGGEGGGGCRQFVNTTSGGGVGHVSLPFEPGVDAWPPLELAPPLEHELERHFVISSAPLHFAGVGISHWEITWR